MKLFILKVENVHVVNKMNEYDDYDYDDYDAFCDSVGMGGGCGEDCPVFLRGDCSEQENAIEDIIKEINDPESEMVLELYDVAIQEMVEEYLDNDIEVKQNNVIVDFDRAMDIFKSYYENIDR